MENRLILAMRLANEAHRGQYRKWGHSDVPYIVHPVRVMSMVAVLPAATEDMVIAAVLHDVLEDSKVVAEDDLRVVFGEEVLALVRALTNPSKGSQMSRAERKAKDREHIAGATWEARLIKLADRIDNVAEMRGDPATPADFAELYEGETRMLLEALKGTDADFEGRLAMLLR